MPRGASAWVDVAMRIDHDGGLLPLELVDGADMRTGNALLKLKNLCVVGRDDEDVVKLSAFVLPSRSSTASPKTERRHDPRNGFGLFSRTSLVAAVGNRHVPQPGPADRPVEVTSCCAAPGHGVQSLS